ncbi:DUF2975 domain-containing protein [Pontimicrobium sp. SW4]|uniref:DUF2975 domain-containing protein n=1 Tax=Pontimicrobium sp. SW4 TaxID=3153519 RepID=A0AAU7BNX4_9FLAO
MSKTNNVIFIGLKIIAWVIFVGLCIEAGGLIVNFFFSLYNPEFIPNLYNKLDLSKLYERSKWLFFGMYSFLLLITILKAFLFYLVVKLVTKMNLSKPFNGLVSRHISLISYYTFSIGLISYIALKTLKSLHYYEYKLSMHYQFATDGRAFILMAAVIYVIAVIFSKGVEYQKELEDTV